MKRICSVLVASALVITPIVGLAQTPKLANPAPKAVSLDVAVVSEAAANADTDLLIFCLFRSSPRNKLAGAVAETNDNLHGLLDKIRTPTLFGGELGETLLITPPAGTMKPKRALLIGMGDSQTFTPERMYLVGKIAYTEAIKLRVPQPYFAAMVQDGGVKTYSTGKVASAVVRGFRDAAQLEEVLRENNDAPAGTPPRFSYLAGPQNAASTREGIASVLSK